ncbi:MULTISPECIES: type II toxin-antitoxin system HicA family toxin [unclassified Nostoc]|uniref:type II toxin-antitoxin system HicA family toxin n=1 Tax=unclassified Nostoc TaxID=2593658 RepID=UPI002631B47C|nr:MULTISPECIES: type II toxin-antitoxin system HicA family toxin [unclassified Nostoc]MDF5739681.1 type II toxin-antitoxin system HicA family toxin [Nostoc sp. S13]MDZ8121689.1 type II toxin-antitoxin system HicA family toxin [Nostoc sp. CmiVER01]
MPNFGPINRRDLIYYLKKLAFEGPYSGTKHQFMVKDELRLIIPNPHEGDISKSLLAKILKQAQVSRDEWEAL